MLAKAAARESVPPPLDFEQDRVDILGVRICRWNMAQTVHAVERSILRAQRTYAVFVNAFNIHEARLDSQYRRALNDADFPMPDGVPLVWASHLLGHPVGSRVCGPDFLVNMNALAAEQGYTVYVLCGGDRKAERTAAAFRATHPSLKIVGACTPPLGLVEGELNEHILSEIARTQPDILWVGLGAPLQERWIWKNRGRIQARFTGAVGGAFDYHIGTRKRAPVWMQKCCLETLCRVAQDPSLTWKKRHYQDFHDFLLPLMWQALQQRLHCKRHKIG
jgi:N-acetylglucosaminyldiphosphoundecaprenol N-acetyl-beta-D-mannosaminyltransferase